VRLASRLPSLSYASRLKWSGERPGLNWTLCESRSQYVPRALGAALALRKLAHGPDQITSRMVESFSRVSTPSVFPAAAGRIGLLGDDAMGVVIIYSLFELGRSGIMSLINSRDPNNISSDTVAASAIPFLTACEYALSVLPKLKTGVAVHDQHDAALLKQIKQAVSKK
jgi:hypothetical protein